MSAEDKVREYRKYMADRKSMLRSNAEFLADGAIEALEDELGELRAAVKEWLCERCNWIYPGPPQPGFKCVVCPKCGGFTAPRDYVEKRRAEAEAQAARERAETHERKLAWMLDEAIALNDWSDDLGCMMQPDEVADMLLARFAAREEEK